ncbi:MULTISPECIES: ABC transporter permease [Halopseudomonas]|uniref:Iron(III) transport system permease protein n=1 Tax=Halopseudomonas bauzanensis TaxID=653930 RepID=A0A1H9NZK2_9GAMM|nr:MULTISPECIES: iron ABC transporter permease [Halopseudomonas]WGK61175.1 iron ABC transporter permease [Halopseudomonas sp. SMJS2]SER41358.1 iron(III) transport system permease protein [Halopseudomonas bauzanensis]SFL77094.1 iron(III) transport system permease protein [Halopseudomonas bauzanensis]
MPLQSTARKTRWQLVAYLCAALVLMPLLVLLISWQDIDQQIWGHLLQTQMLRLISNTLWLIAGVAAGVILLGVSLAWLTSLCDFPGRRWLDWALMLPFAVPAYVLAFVMVGLLDFAGPLQSLLRDWFGNDFRLPPIRSTGGVILTLVLVFYPYVYMLARSAFLAQGRGLMEASRILGQTPWQGFWRVAIPMARPAISAGTALAIMETLADFGAVSVFNYDTFTTAIYKTWYGFFSLQSATQLASLLLLFVFLALFAERRAQGRNKRFPANDKPRKGALYRLKGPLAWLASGYCLLVLAIAFVIPVGQLLFWLLSSGIADLDSRYWGLIRNTLTLGGIAAALTVSVAILLVLAQRLQPIRRVRSAVALANLGYALPGSVLAVGIMFFFSYLDNHLVVPLQAWLGMANPAPLLLGGLFALLLAYLIRFMAVAYGPLDTSLARIRPSLPEAAQSLGQPGWVVFWRIYVPLLLPGILSAALLVFVDVLKEMPATLLMRPFGWDTLAVRIHALTTEGDWTRASLPALTLVLVGLLPVIVLIRRSGRH